jgi:hypothetical protein
MCTRKITINFYYTKCVGRIREKLPQTATTVNSWRSIRENLPQTLTTLNSWRCIREKLPQTVTTVNSWRCIREKLPQTATTPTAWPVQVKKFTRQIIGAFLHTVFYRLLVHNFLFTILLMGFF